MYLGAPNVAEFAPGNNSYIDMRKYASPEDLADTLLAMAADAAQYSRLLAWRQHGVTQSFQRLMDMSMTRSQVYGEGKHHGCQHQVDLRHLHSAMCHRLVNVSQRRLAC